MEGGFKDDSLALEAYGSDEQLFRLSSDYSGLTGDVTDVDRYLGPSIIRKEGCVAYGLYYSDSGQASGFTDHHQLYAVATENQSNWMGRLFDKLGREKIDRLQL